MTIDNLKQQVEETLGTTKKSFRLGELRILCVLFSPVARSHRRSSYLGPPPPLRRPPSRAAGPRPQRRPTQNPGQVHAGVHQDVSRHQRCVKCPGPGRPRTSSVFSTYAHAVLGRP
ncbi:hypothetical protein B0T17DRAFT_400699 [Bombardia bombarda]|uniref:Uncharacterized protein n=1 Tax=Bombardia bombarda TaxID=252184 RepID=A0AA39TMY7_9PEZI|nr:hypothetical protein B0T17DRAFT_400699 [Bombardia bombarda]